MTITADQIFNQLAKTIAYPHTTITKHDKKRALEIMQCLDEYMLNNFCLQDRDLETEIDKVTADLYFEDHPEERNYVKDWEAIRV
jgi:hypothetical protein